MYVVSFVTMGAQSTISSMLAGKMLRPSELCDALQSCPSIIFYTLLAIGVSPTLGRVIL